MSAIDIKKNKTLDQVKERVKKEPSEGISYKDKRYFSKIRSMIKKLKKGNK